MTRDAFAPADPGPSVLVLCDEVGRTGGTEAYLSRVLPALRDRGVVLRIAARRVVDPAAFGVPATEFAWGGDDEPARPAAAEAVRETIATWRPDVVIASNVHDAAVMAAARTAPRLIVRVHDHRLFCPQGDRQYPHFRALCTQPMGAGVCLPNAIVRGCIAGLSPRSVRLLRSRRAVQQTVLQADRLVVSSRFMADFCTLNGVAEERVSIVPPPFDGDVVCLPRPSRDRVLFAGRLVRDKGLGSLIGALAKIPREFRPALAVAAAMTDEAAGLPAEAARLGVAFEMLGKVDPERLKAEIDASSIVAVPSLWPEPFGLMGIESFARGRPVVAYDVGSISTWMGEAGIAVRRGDERAFARAVRTVLEPSRWPLYSAAAVRQAADYRIGGHADALIALLR